MPNVHGIEFNANQSELVKDLVRELLKDGNCAVYALNNMKPNGELRMATTLPTPNRREVGGVFLRIRPGINQATIVRPMNAKAGGRRLRNATDPQDRPGPAAAFVQVARDLGLSAPRATPRRHLPE